MTTTKAPALRPGWLERAIALGSEINEVDIEFFRGLSRRETQIAVEGAHAAVAALRAGRTKRTPTEPVA